MRERDDAFVYGIIRKSSLFSDWLIRLDVTCASRDLPKDNTHSQLSLWALGHKTNIWAGFDKKYSI